MTWQTLPTSKDIDADSPSVDPGTPRASADGALKHLAARFMRGYSYADLQLLMRHAPHLEQLRRVALAVDALFDQHHYTAAGCLAPMDHAAFYRTRSRLIRDLVPLNVRWAKPVEVGQCGLVLASAPDRPDELRMYFNNRNGSLVPAGASIGWHGTSLTELGLLIRDPLGHAVVLDGGTLVTPLSDLTLPNPSLTRPLASALRDAADGLLRYTNVHSPGELHAARQLMEEQGADLGR